MITLPILLNFHIYTSLEQSLVVETTNDTCIKYSISPHVYKVFSTYSHKISGWKILSRLLHSHAPHLGGVNGDVQSDLATLEFKNGEQLEDFHSIILGL